MKRFLVIIVLSWCFPLAIAAQDATTSPKSTVSITIKVLNGKTGKTVWRESPNIWIDNEGAFNPTTNLQGKAKIKVSRGSTQLRMTPNFGHECRWKESDTKRTVSYSIAEILQSGIVSQNVCGVVSIAPTPGILVFYELPSTLRELWYN